MSSPGTQWLAVLTTAAVLGGCSPTGLPLAPSNRSLPSGRETADAAGTAAVQHRKSTEQRTIYNSNIEGESRPPEDEAAADEPGASEREPSAEDEGPSTEKPERPAQPTTPDAGSSAGPDAGTESGGTAREPDAGAASPDAESR